MSDINDLQEKIAQFAQQRDWEQFHTPKNLSMALAGEVGELLAELQWMNDDEIASEFEAGEEFKRRMCDELADVAIYVARLHDILAVDLIDNAMAKIARNEERYPAAKARGNATKHNRLGDR